MDNSKRIAIKFMAKPEVCPQCGGRVVDLVYGLPSEETMAAAGRGEIKLGGCMWSEDLPEWICAKCGQHYKKD